MIMVAVTMAVGEAIRGAGRHKQRNIKTRPEQTYFVAAFLPLYNLLVGYCG
jgi:hypothetical protein